jgi:hypothetical protein
MLDSQELAWEADLEEELEDLEADLESLLESPRPRRGRTGPGHWTGNAHGGPDRLEDRHYQRQITGEPAYRDYLVTDGHVAALFDGYKRRTLLEAKHLSHDGSFVNLWNWALRTHRQLPDNAQRRVEGIIEQARRQRHVAGNTPIEWHVASKPAARIIRHLLTGEKVDGHDVLRGKGPAGIRIVVTPPRRPLRRR